MSHKDANVRAKSFLEFVKEAVEVESPESTQTAQDDQTEPTPEPTNLNPAPAPNAALAPDLESIPLPNSSVATPESPAPVVPAPINPMEPVTAPLQIGMGNDSKTIILNGYVSNIGDTHANKVITDQIVASDSSMVEQINLYELNIMSVDVNDTGKEPADGMSQIYKAIDDASVLIISAEVKNGQISGVLQTCLERIAQHYTKQELRNKVLGTVITGKEASHVSTRSSIVTFAMGMGMIVGGDCNIYSVSDDTLGVHSPADVTSFMTCINELVKATSSIRQTIQANAVGGEAPFMSYDDFDSQMSDVPTEHGTDIHDGNHDDAEPEADPVGDNADIAEFTKSFADINDDEPVAEEAPEASTQAPEPTDLSSDAGTGSEEEEVAVGEEEVVTEEEEEECCDDDEDEDEILSFDKFAG